MLKKFLIFVLRVLRKPPSVIIARVWEIALSHLDRILLPLRNRLTLKRFLKETEKSNIDKLWRDLASHPFPAVSKNLDSKNIVKFLGPKQHRIFQERVNSAMNNRVNLLGSGPIDLGENIDWHTDFKTNISWKPKFYLDINYNNPSLPSDVKVPWELSRLQWLIPVAQSYLVTKDEIYAEKVKTILSQWIDENPVGFSVNWACTMEAAMRVFSWVWFFHVFKYASSWKDPAFRFKFLKALYLKVEFTAKHLEWSDVNGNHFTADVASLVIGGLFFNRNKYGEAWANYGWDKLQEEIEKQVFDDGVDFEASVPYHRLVTELFFWPAYYRSFLGLEVSQKYKKKLGLMCKFVSAYNMDGHSIPLFGDADDARVLPFGLQDINDHGYLPVLLGWYLKDEDLLASSNNGYSELFWHCGSTEAKTRKKTLPCSAAFRNGGFFIMKTPVDRVFIDCGPVGLAGRGGHGHNDCLSFDAVLKNVPIVTDSGSYVYTASYDDRDRFRSTTMHNTLQVDGQEINRYIHPDYIWNLRNDALPMLIDWKDTNDTCLFVGEHSGYERLVSPVTPRRQIVLDKSSHTLTVTDEVLGEGIHSIKIPLHLHDEVQIKEQQHNSFTLSSRKVNFKLRWKSTCKTKVLIEDSFLSKSYGVKTENKKIVWAMTCELPCKFKMSISPI